MKRVNFFVVCMLILLCFFIAKEGDSSYALVQVSAIKVDTYNSDRKVAYLTFDDGPSKRVTPKVLDILDKYDIRASFFVIGSKVKEYPEILRQEYEAGHFIGNHTFSHKNGKIYRSKESFLEEIEETDKAIEEALEIENFKCKIFRFPNGSVSKSYAYEKKLCQGYLDEIGYKYIDWNALNNDSIRKYSNEQLLENLKKTVNGKSTVIVLMHDSGDVNKTYDVLEASIKFLIDEGFEFRTLYDFI